MCTWNQISAIFVGRNSAFHFKPVYWDIDFRWLWYIASWLLSMLCLFLYVCQECTYWMDCWFNEKCICINLGTRKEPIHSHNILYYHFFSMLISMIYKKQLITINRKVVKSRLFPLLTINVFSNHFKELLYIWTFAVKINTQPIVFFYHK